MKIGEVLYEAGDPIHHVYFPLSGMVSMVIASQEGATIEVGVVGNEGIVGISAVVGSNASHWKALIQVQGELLRMPAQDFRDECERDAFLADMVQRFTQSLLIQVAQSVMCNRLHPMEERICRWLLMTHDRAGTDQIGLTQEFISQMLGIRRPSVTVAAGMLQKAGFIEYSRGKVTVLDRAGLENTACECYAVVRRELEGLLLAR
jgi:CRP-like cAMP-binding protein